jgi:hypothetical protein
MTSPQQKPTVIKAGARALLATALPVALLLAGGSAWAGTVVGVVAHLSGPLLDRKADGSTRVLGPKSDVEDGDTLVSEKNTYAQIRFIDNHDITLQPGTTFRIDHFAYDAAKPEGDSAAFSLVKGGLRSITGLLGKRNKEKFELKTPSATIGIRGTTFIVQYVPALAPSGAATVPAAPTVPAAGTSTLTPGLYVSVLDGMIAVTNSGGAQNVAAGQFGYVPSVTTAPVLVPANPGVQFTPPPAFSATTAAGTPASATPAKANSVDCEVR